MKKIVYLFVCLGVILFSACADDVPTSVKDNSNIRIELSEYEDASALHSIVLDCAAEIVKEQNIDLDQLTQPQVYTVTQDAVLRGVQKYISQREGRSLTSTEQNTLKAEVSNYWNDSSSRALMKKIAQSSTPINPNTGNADLNTLYTRCKIKPEAQKYLNKMFGNMDLPNYESYLDGLVMDVWSTASGLSSDEKLSLINVITVTKDSYQYWNRNVPMTRLSRTAKSIIISDAVGGVWGFFRGLGRSAGSLIFGPGGAVLTITGSVIVGAAESSVGAAITEGLLRI